MTTRKRMWTRAGSTGLATALVMIGVAAVVGRGADAAPASASATEGPYVAAPSLVEAGRYLVIVGGCNDCHTPGWAESNGALPDDAWLTGAPVGFRGSWGTSYPANLRLAAQAYSEDAFVARVRSGVGLPPMPWMNVSRMSDRDLRAIYAFVRGLGPAGTPAPAAVPPGTEPTTPFIVFEPVMPTGAGRR